MQNNPGPIVPEEKSYTTSPATPSSKPSGPEFFVLILNRYSKQWESTPCKNEGEARIKFNNYSEFPRLAWAKIALATKENGEKKLIEVLHLDGRKRAAGPEPDNDHAEQ